MDGLYPTIKPIKEMELTELSKMADKKDFETIKLYYFYNVEERGSEMID